MKILVTVIFGVVLFLKSNGQGIDFRQISSWSEVKKVASEENKYIFLDLYATWCGPCKQMDNLVFPSNKVGSFFNEKFVSVKIQMDRTKSDDEHAKLWYADAEKIARQFKIPGYPTYLYFSPQGELIHKVSGAISIDNFLRESQLAISSTNAVYPELARKYREGKLDILSYKKMARLALRFGEDSFARNVYQDYIDRISNDSLYTIDNLIFMAEFIHNTRESGFKILFNDSTRVNQVINDKIGQQYIANTINDIIYNEQVVVPFEKNSKMSYSEMKSNLLQYGQRGLSIYYEKIIPIILNNEELLPLLKESNLINWKELEKRLVGKYGSTAKKSVWAAEAYSYFRNKDVKRFVEIKTKILNEYPHELTNSRLGDDAWFVFEHSLVKEDLETALEWCRKIISEEPENAATMDTYANLLYKLGRKKEALKWEEKAMNLDLGRKEIAENLRKMKINLPTWKF